MDRVRFERRDLQPAQEVGEDHATLAGAGPEIRRNEPGDTDLRAEVYLAVRQIRLCKLSRRIFGGIKTDDVPAFRELRGQTDDRVGDPESSG